MEIWKPIQWYETYEISSLWRIRNTNYRRTWETKVLAPYVNSSGYQFVQLWNMWGFKNMKIHRLVAEAFITNSWMKPQVNHLNGLKTDNRVENLEWCTNGENQKHAYSTGLKVPAEWTGFPKSPVMQFMDGKLVWEYESAMDASRKTWISQWGISKCCRWESKSAGGYTWKLKDQSDELGEELLELIKP